MGMFLDPFYVTEQVKQQGLWGKPGLRGFVCIVIILAGWIILGWQFFEVYKALAGGELGQVE